MFTEPTEHEKKLILHEVKNCISATEPEKGQNLQTYRELYASNICDLSHIPSEYRGAVKALRKIDKYMLDNGVEDLSGVPLSLREALEKQLTKIK